MNWRDDFMEPNELPEELLNLRQTKTFTIPAGYFENLADDILSKVNLPLSATVPLSAPPANYFEGFADSVLSKIKNNTPVQVVNEVQEELKEMDPFLASLAKTNVYTVPDNYFETLHFAPPVVKKVAPVKRIFLSSPWFSSAAAAVVTGIIATSIFFYSNGGDTLQPQSGTSYSYSQKLSQIPDSQISDYLSSAPHDFDVLPASQEGAKTMDSESIYKALLNNVSDNEIQNYLNENESGNEKNIKGI